MRPRTASNAARYWSGVAMGVGLFKSFMRALFLPKGRVRKDRQFLSSILSDCGPAFHANMAASAPIELGDDGAFPAAHAYPAERLEGLQQAPGDAKGAFERQAIFIGGGVIPEPAAFGFLFVGACKGVLD